MKPDEDNRISPQEIPPPTRNGRALVEGNAEADQIEIIRARYNLTRQQAEELFQDFEEFMGANMAEASSSQSQAVAEALNKRDAEWFLWLGKILRELDVYARKQSAKDYVQASIVTMLFVCGFSDYANAKSFAEIARNELRRFRKTSGKATITKCAAHFLGKLKLAPMLTQRTEAARQEMANARIEQLTKPKTSTTEQISALHLCTRSLTG